MATGNAYNAVDKILANLSDRSGLGFDDVDDDIMEEIREELAEIIDIEMDNEY